MGIASIFYACNPSATDHTTDALSSEVIKAKKTVTPPIDGMKVPYKTYKVNPKEGAKINLVSGTSINIPSGAFVDANGNEITEPIDICYREFHTPAEVLASGIPMGYDSAGVHADFATSGMFEIRALDQENQELQLANNKSIDVNLASHTNGGGYNIYHFKEETQDLPKIEEANFFNILLQIAPQVNVTTKKETILETKEIQGAWVFKGAPKVEENKAKKELADSLLSIKELVKPIEPLQFDPKAYTFDLNFDVKEFDELEGFENVFWQYSGNDPKTDPAKSKLMSSVGEWNDIKIEPSAEKKGAYIMTLVSGIPGNQKIFKTEVTPMLKGKNLAKAQAKFAKKMEKFEQKMQKKITAQKRQALMANYLRGVRVTTMGFWNTDKPISKETFDLMVKQNKEKVDQTQKTMVFTNAKFELNQQEVPVKSVYAISTLTLNNQYRGVDQDYTTTARFEKEELDNFYISPLAENKIIVPMTDGRVGYVDKQILKNLDYAKIKERGELTLSVKVLPQEYTGNLNTIQKFIDSL